MEQQVTSTTDSADVVAQAMVPKGQKDAQETAVPAGTEGALQDKNEAQDLGGNTQNEDPAIDDADDTEGEVNEQDGKPKKKTGYQRKIEAQQKRAEAAEKRAQELESNLEFLRRETQRQRETPKPEVKEPDTLKKPNRNDFDTVDAYEEAYETYVEKKTVRTIEQKQREDKIRVEVEGLNRSHTERMNAFREKNPDIDERLRSVAGKYDVPAWVNHALFKSEFGPEIMHEITGNTQELKRISDLAKSDPEAVYKAIHRLEFKFEAERYSAKGKNKDDKSSVTSISGKKETETKRIPEPISPVRSRGSSQTAKSLYDENLSLEDWNRLRDEDIRSRKTRR